MADLTRANLTEANLTGANLTGATLTGATLTGARLTGATLTEADLTWANLSRANLSRANLFKATLTGATLTGARLNWASHDLVSAILFGAAGDCEAKRQLAGLVIISRDWCWPAFASLDLDIELRAWAVSVLATYIQDGDTAPAILRRAASKEVA